MKKIFSIFILLLFFMSNVFAQAQFPSIQVGNRSKPLTNAKIKSVSESGISFLCDQGLIKVPFEFLPEEFQKYKGEKASPPTTPSAKSIAPQNKVNAQKPVPKPIEKEKNPEQVALENEKMRKKYEREIKNHEYTIDTYTRQSSFSGKEQITEAQYNEAKVGLENAKRGLADLK